MDNIRTANNKTRPFYLFLVSKMMRHADGALLEALGNACKAIAGEFLISCDGKAQCLHTSLQRALGRCDPRYKPWLSELYREIDRHVKNGHN